MLETICVKNPRELVKQLRLEVAAADAAVLIAPQPDMQKWLSALGPLANKVLGWPLTGITQAEDKVNSTQVPSLLVVPEQPDWKFFPLDTNTKNENTFGESTAAQWYAQHLRAANVWALKPNDRCGGSDVWRITLRTPIADFDVARQTIAQLREEIPGETLGKQRLLWSPWIDGEPGSLLILATPRGWWCFPPCRQNLQFRSIAIPPAFQALVSKIETVTYQGSEFVPNLLTTGSSRLLWEQFAGGMNRGQRQSLLGWFGIDFVAATPEHATLIEVNPRLTSSYNLHRHWRFAPPNS
ncbi:MAG: ATP-grasp domain-containing protein [Planctomycetaceae bacterium]|nr:ATP-grasp domain-containing protein [Planctomycetaceae bacterium]